MIKNLKPFFIIKFSFNFFHIKTKRLETHQLNIFKTKNKRRLPKKIM